MKNYLSKCIATLFATAAVVACEPGWLPDNPRQGGDAPLVDGIPSDSWAEWNPQVTDPNVSVPNFNYTVEEVNGHQVIRFNMNGIQNPKDMTQWLRLYGTERVEQRVVVKDGAGNSYPITEKTNQNIYISIDYRPKGISVINTIDQGTIVNPAVDIVFLVDNSGSMDGEANAIARDITEWASNLSKTLDIRFGCVGYGRNVGEEYGYLVNDYGVSGALNLTSFEELNQYLNGRSYSGVDRTVGYYGADAATLETIAKKNEYSQAGGECGIQALRFADENFNFRKGVNRIYINFTDDANYTGGNPDISIDYVKNPATWPAEKGTIHSVISNDAETIEYRAYTNPGNGEISWLPSDYTGGTTIYVPSTFAGVSLDDLPVTEALKNTYIISMTNVEDLFDGMEHTVWITIYSPDGTIQGEKEFKVVFTK